MIQTGSSMHASCCLWYNKAAASQPELARCHAAVEVEHNLVVPVSTDKGLCGGINSTVSKYARGTIAAFEGGKHQAQQQHYAHPQTVCFLISISFSSSLTAPAVLRCQLAS